MGYLFSSDNEYFIVETISPSGYESGPSAQSCLSSRACGPPPSVSASVGSSELTFRGLEWNIDLSVTAQDRLLWSSQSTFLYRCKTDIERQPLKDKSSPLESICNWSVSEHIGRQYATVSGDYNPIHLSALTAKLFGFKRAIAHGMWSKARCLAELDQHIPDAGYTVDVNFRRPVFLPSKVCLSAQQSQDSHRFSYVIYQAVKSIWMEPFLGVWLCGFKVPVNDYLFLFNEVMDMQANYKHINLVIVTPDMLEAIFTEGAKFCENELAPLYQSGDDGCRWHRGEVQHLMDLKRL